MYNSTMLIFKNHAGGDVFSPGFPKSTSKKKKISEKEWLYPNVLRDLRMPVDSIIKPHHYHRFRVDKGTCKNRS